MGRTDEAGKGHFSSGESEGVTIETGCEGATGEDWKFVIPTSKWRGLKNIWSFQIIAQSSTKPFDPQKITVFSET